MVRNLAEARGVREALQWFTREKQWINEMHLQLCRIPSPTFLEGERAHWVAAQFRSLGCDAQIDRAGNDCPRRDSLHRRPQRSDIKPGAGVLGSGELVKQHPARAGDRLGGLLQPRQHRQPLPGRRAAGRAEQPGRHQQRQQVQRVIDRGRLQVPHHRDQRRGPLRLAQPRQRRSLAPQTCAC